MTSSLRAFSRTAAFSFLSIFWIGTTPAEAQSSRPSGRDAALALRFDELRFDPPRVQKRTLDSGVSVFHSEDHSLPLVTFFARFHGGYALLPRTSYAAASALPGLLRTGGTASLPPDSVDHLLDYYALQVTFGGGGQSTFATLNTLTKHLTPAAGLWTEILGNPGFDLSEMEVWRDRQLEGVRRSGDDPGFMAVSEFNRIMFGDHPIGWEMQEEDLTPDRFNQEALFGVYSKVLCRENLILGVVGDVSWGEVAPLLDDMVSGLPPCAEPIPEPEPPELRRGRTVFLIPKELTQSTVVMAAPGGVSLSADPDYFASRIGNSILGANGFSSRLLSQVRTEHGYAYSASSLWTTPSNYEGIVGAFTQTKSESTVTATRLILDIISEMREVPPDQEEVDQVVARTVNSFVFNFQDPSQIVSRQMFYLSQGLPEDWLERYVRGIQRVDPDAVRDVFFRHVHPEEMIILIVGNPADFDFPPEVLGEVQIWDPAGGQEPIELQREGRRSPR